MALQFNDVGNEQGFCQEIDTICKTTVENYPLKVKARRMNFALATYFQKVMQWCGNWSLGDINNTTDLGEATTDVISTQQDYSLDSTMLILDSVWLKVSGEWKQLESVAGNINTTKTGVPTKYTKTENSIVFDVIPDYDLTNGIKIFYRRTLPIFTYDDTTQTSGAPAIHDMYLARMASLPYLIENGKASKNDVAAQIQADEMDIKNYYSSRSRDERPLRMVANYQNNK